MGPGPGQNRKNRDNGNGNPPHEKIDFSGMTPFRHISRFGIGSSVLSGKPESHDEDGNDDDQHEHDGRNDDEPLRLADRSFGVEQEYRAATSEESYGTSGMTNRQKRNISFSSFIPQHVKGFGPEL